MSFSEAIAQHGIEKSDFERLIGIGMQEKIVKTIQKGNRIEITPTKDGVKVREIKTNVIQ